MLRSVLLSSLSVYWPPERFGKVIVAWDESDADREAAERVQNEYSGFVRCIVANRSLIDVHGGSPVNAGSPGYHLQVRSTRS